MAEPKTKPTSASVDEFLAASGREEDSRKVLALMKKVTKQPPVMWGPSIVGFGTYQSPSGPWPLTGFSPRKTALTLYIMAGFDGYPELMAKLGKHKTGKSCLYLSKLADVDMKVLEELIRRSVAYMRERFK